MRIELNYFDGAGQEQSRAFADVEPNSANIPPPLVKARVAGKGRVFYRHNWSTEYYEATPVAVKIRKGGK